MKKVSMTRLEAGGWFAGIFAVALLLGILGRIAYQDHQRVEAIWTAVTMNAGAANAQQPRIKEVGPPMATPTKAAK